MGEAATGAELKPVGGPAALSPLAYRPQLDGLRAVAVTAVLFHHFWHGSAAGPLGVRLFFVLSGLLITEILLQPRTGGRGGTLANFYIRRALRIFPLYFAVAIAAVTVIDGMRESGLWHLTYTTNFLFVREGAWDPSVASHLWSLDVEEQFYLLWAPFVLLASRRVLVCGTLAMMVGAPLFRGFFDGADAAGVTRTVLLPDAMDALGAGALLAVIETGRRFRWLRPAPLLVGGLIALPLLYVSREFLPYVGRYRIVLDTIALLPIAAMVLGASRGARGVAGRLLASWPLRALGKISYGVYLLHLFVAFALLKIPPLSTLQRGPVEFVLMSAATITAAAISWRFFERPLNELKRFFPYGRAVDSPAATCGENATNSLASLGEPSR